MHQMTQLKTQMDKKAHEVVELQKSLQSARKSKEEELKKTKAALVELESEKKAVGMFCRQM